MARRTEGGEVGCCACCCCCCAEGATAALGERGVNMLDEVGEKDASVLLLLGELQWLMAGVALWGCSGCCWSAADTAA